MIGTRQVGQAWQLFRAKWLIWIAAGLLAAATELGIAFLPFAGGPRAIGARPWVLHLAGFAVTFLSFLIAGGLVRAALSQVRTGCFSPALFIPRNVVAGQLVLLATGSIFGQYVLGFASSTLGPTGWILRLVVSYALGVPFALAIPLAVGGGLRAVQAGQESIRLLLPRYWGMLTIQIAVFATCYLALLPVTCLGMWTGPNSSPTGQVLFWAHGGLTYVLGLPIYYLAIACAYEALRAPTLNVETEAAVSADHSQ